VGGRADVNRDTVTIEKDTSMDNAVQELSFRQRGLSWGRRTGGAALVAAVLGSALSVAPATAAEPPVGTSDDGALLSSSWRSDVDLGSFGSILDGAGVPAARAGVSAKGEHLTGAGVGVALIDSGVVPVQGLDAPGKVVNGPDLSFESQQPSLLHLDTFGHGTHLAGIIAGRDSVAPAGASKGKVDGFVGVAPDASIVNVKVAASDGAVDVSQVIAALDWVVQHRDDDGMNIRVVNLAYGTDSTQSYLADPLAHAVEAAWRHGIVVVVAAGNGGNLTEALVNPATDPFVISVGAADHKGTKGRNDDTVADFSARGSASRSPDLVAPGRSLVSLRNPGSLADEENSSAVVTDGAGAPRFFRGSGTSQAAAFVAGSAALLLQQRPELTPDQVKELLTSTASPVRATDVRLQGHGLIDVAAAARAKTPSQASAVQPFAASTGTGSLELARGTHHVADPETGEELVGEQDIFGSPWDGRSWSQLAAAGRSWSGGDWNGRSWSGRSWSGQSWSGRSWSGVSWSGRSWSGRSWSDESWAGRSWSGRSWSGRSWSDGSWAGRSWSGRSWSGRSWSWSATDGAAFT
jgi:serine protease AprX